MYRVGLLQDAASAAEDPRQAEAALRSGLSELGYVEGRNVAIEARYTAGDAGRLAAAAEDLARLPVDVFATAALAATQAALAASSTIPIVHLLGGGDLVDDGLAASLARPGGRVTGQSSFSPRELIGKWLELLKGAAPGISRGR